MTLNSENFFDFYGILVNELIGGVELTAIVMSLVIVVIGIKYKMPYEGITLLCTLWLMILFTQANGLIVIYVMLLLLVAMMFYFAVYKKLIKTT